MPSNVGDIDCSSEVEDADDCNLSCRLPSRTRALTSAHSIVTAYMCMGGGRSLTQKLMSKIQNNGGDLGGNA